MKKLFTGGEKLADEHKAIANRRCKSLGYLKAALNQYPQEEEKC